jgi:hypothetical protein
VGLKGGKREGDGWVDWSGLATLVADVALDHLHKASWLMQLVGTCDTQLSRASRTVAQDMTKVAPARVTLKHGRAATPSSDSIL